MSVTQALAQIPDGLRSDLESAWLRNGGFVNALIERQDMDPVRALMAGLAMNPNTRTMFENALDEYVSVDESLPNEWPEVVVGGGAHAAIWAAVRNTPGVGTTGVKPLVLEKQERFGGTFARTRNPTFYLNSRNRPGPIGAAGSRDALNVILGAPMQPADISGSEYQANADLGLVVRCTLALNAVVRQARVTEIVRNGSDLVVVTDRGAVRTKRVVVATGIGTPRKFNGTRYDDKLMWFDSFMRRFDRSMFPLRNIGRVAVIGGGDSGRTVVEALAGYGPYLGGSVASIDYVPQIDWYGPGNLMTKERWLECNRTRYKPLAALFPSASGQVRNARVTPYARASTVFRTSEGVQVDSRSYDTVVCCVGYMPGMRQSIKRDDSIVWSTYRSGNMYDAAGRGVILGQVSPDRQFVIIGPAAQIPFEAAVDPDGDENQVALFRLAPRTATLAMQLPV